MLYLNHKTYGSRGHPLIILHGLLGMLDNWQTQSKLYAEAGMKVYAIDQRNHGKSPHRDVFNFEAMARDAHDFMNQHAIASAYVLGHSMGGKTAMQFALTYPELVDKLVVVDVAPKKYPAAHDEILDAMASLKLNQFITRQEADNEIAKRLPKYSLRQFVLKNLARAESGELKWKVNLPVIKKHYPEIAGDITVDGVFAKPTLFIKGGRSNYIRQSDEKRMHKLFPTSTILTLPDAGHWIHAEKPEEFGKVVLKFLLS